MNASTRFLVATLCAWFNSSLRSIRLAVLMGVLLVLNTCATAQALGTTGHGFDVENKGDSKIFHVVIQYGKVTRIDCDPYCLPKRGGGSWNVDMPIADQ